MATIIIGMGNPVLTDDSVGLKIVQRIAELLPATSGIAVRELHVGGIGLMESMAGYDRAIIVDAICTPEGVPGTVYSPTVDDLFHSRNTCSTHDANLDVALELGKLAGLHLPSRIHIWAVEAGEVTAFGEQLTEAVQRAVPLVVDYIMDVLSDELCQAAKSGECA
jgi:hydrogenase maturation protease